MPKLQTQSSSGAVHVCHGVILGNVSKWITWITTFVCPSPGCKCIAGNNSNLYIFVFLSIVDLRRINVSQLNDELPGPYTKWKLENAGFSGKGRAHLSKAVNTIYTCSLVSCISKVLKWSGFCEPRASLSLLWTINRLLRHAQWNMQLHTSCWGEAQLDARAWQMSEWWAAERENVPR